MIAVARCLFVFLIATFCCHSASAQFAIHSYTTYTAELCQGCNTDAEWEQKVLNSQFGMTYLYSFESNEIRAYHKGTVPVGVGFRNKGQYKIKITRETVPEKMLSTFEGARMVWAVNDHTLSVKTAHVPLSPDTPSLPRWLREASAFDVAVSSSFQFLMEKWLLNMSETALDGIPGSVSAKRFITNVGDGAWARLVFGGNPFSWQFIIEMPQGGTVLMKINYQSPRLWEYVEARDANGNKLPESIHDLEGIYRFPVSHESWISFNGNPWGVSWPEYFCPVVACVAFPPLPPPHSSLRHKDKDKTSPDLENTLDGIGQSGSHPQINMEIHCSCAN